MSEAVFFGGFPGGERIAIAEHDISFGLYGAMVPLTDFTQYQLCARMEPEYRVDVRDLGLPPEGYDLGGVSGGPMLQPVYRDDRWRWRLVGVLSEAVAAQGFERITAVRAHFILPMGGWAADRGPAPLAHRRCSSRVAQFCWKFASGAAPERGRDISPAMSDPSEWNTRGWFVETEDELSAIDDMESASDRTAAIVIASLVETRLTNTLQAGLDHDDAIVERLFRASGPLGSFSAKIDLACLMGAISKDAYRDLVILKNIRNIFAHQFKSASFEEQRIGDLCRNFRLIETMICDMEEEAPLMKHPPFTLKITGYRHHLSNPRGRYMLTGHLFVAGLDKRTAKRHTSTIYDPWI